MVAVRLFTVDIVWCVSASDAVGDEDTFRLSVNHCSFPGHRQTSHVVST